MSSEIISTLLEWNPWFEGEVPASLVGIQRDYDVMAYLAIPEIKILEGVRRSGKSTLLYQIVQHATQQQKKVLYINFDDDLLQQHSLADIYYAFLQYSQVDYLLIDEIQQCRDWVPTVRKFYDRREIEQIWITGSNSSLISKEYAELLTGRNIKIAISPLSFSEFLRFKSIGNSQLPLSPQRRAEVIKQFNDYLTTGAFPAIALRPVFQRELLNNYFEDFIYKDIATRHTVNITKLRDLALYLATNSAKLFSYRKVAHALGLHTNTVNDYISHMREVFLFDEVYKFDYSLKSQYLTEKKVYMIDTGLANTVSFRFSEDKGRMLETLVHSQLKRLGHEIYFHRDKHECDFIVKQGLDITQVIQVTCSLADPNTRERELAGLQDALRVYPQAQGLILTLDEEENASVTVDGKQQDVIIQPVWQWML